MVLERRMRGEKECWSFHRRITSENEKKGCEKTEKRSSVKVGGN